MASVPKYTLKPPCLADKLVDWRLLESVGGQSILEGKIVVEFGPAFAIDALLFAEGCASYTIVESDPTVIEHLYLLLDARIRFRNEGVPRGGHGPVVVHDCDLRQPPITALPADFADVVIDFGTIDNVTDPPAGIDYSISCGRGAYAEAARILKPGGLLLTTFADLRHFGVRASACGDEIRLDPQELAEYLQPLGLDPVHALEPLPAPRIGMAFRKRG